MIIFNLPKPRCEDNLKKRKLTALFHFLFASISEKGLTSF
ncbi:hypothetical protein HMPREF9104_00229 [Lentilactobacillus kisonensis F0435]|uniref:Uncharacterized protein n=1 Tax=Lentilactobacillus kisonensis F0435 TaxID=797516 RepID=H1LCB6_9LACO|nr:hypothetical protein HMPREF9104_00229 [Lentilactobacillus kisonensis F0435]